MPNYRKIEYLSHGNPRQKAACAAIERLHILEILQDFDPILVGTIPLAIDIAGSDLDIVCQVDHFERFSQLLFSNFGTCKDYRQQKKSGPKGLILVSNFQFMGFEFEIYASSEPVESLNGYRHMIIEDRILKLLGDTFRREVIARKEKGLKTEPAFASLLKLDGDPYKSLLSLEHLSNQEIQRMYDMAQE